MATHLPDDLTGFIKAAELNQGVALRVARFAIEIEVQTLDFPKLGKSIEEVVFLYLLVEVGDDENPSFDSWVSEIVHLMG